MKTIFTMALFSLLGQGATETKTDPVPHSAPEIRIEKNLLDQIYGAEVHRVQETVRRSGTDIEVGAQFSYANPTEFELNNPYFTVPYGLANVQVPLVHLTLTKSITRIGTFVEIDGQFRAGYGQKEGIFRVQSKTGAEFRDNLRVHWVPLSLSARIALRVPGVSFVKPSVALGAGTQWIDQGGKLDGINQSFWVPFYQVIPALTFFDLSEGDHWFSGVTTSATLGRSLGSAQTLRYWSLDMGVGLRI